MSPPPNNDPPDSAGALSPTPAVSGGPEPARSRDHPEHTASQSSPIDRIKAQALKAQIIEVLRTCYDPEIPVDIYALGLIYDVDVEAAGTVRIQMTLTSPACPVAGSLPPEVESRIEAVDGVTNVSVELVWDPPWTPERMSEAAKLQLNL